MGLFTVQETIEVHPSSSDQFKGQNGALDEAKTSR